MAMTMAGGIFMTSRGPTPKLLPMSRSLRPNAVIRVSTSPVILGMITGLSLLLKGDSLLDKNMRAPVGSHK